MKNEAEKIDNPQGNGVLPCVSTSCIHTWKEEWQSCLGFERHKKLLADNHMINIRIRKDGEWHEIDADWLKTLVRQEF